MKIAAILYSGLTGNFSKAGKNLDFLNLKIFNERELQEDKFLDELKERDLIIIYGHSYLLFENEEVKKLSKKIPTMFLSVDYLSYSTVEKDILFKCYEYMQKGGYENIENMFKFIGNKKFSLNIKFDEPKDLISWEGIYHSKGTKAQRHKGTKFEVFTDRDKYIEKYIKNKNIIGILFYRSNIVNKNLQIINAIIKSFEGKNYDVLACFSQSAGKTDFGSLTSNEVMGKFFFKDNKPIIDTFINLQNFHKGDEIFQKLNVPVFSPILSYYKTEEEWRENFSGIDGLSISWQVALPEFSGMIEPIIVGCKEKDEEFEIYKPIDERIEKLTDRVIRWIELKNKKNKDKKVAFILHNNPCASVEATVGAGAHLDTLESVARIIKRMKEVGYKLHDEPKDGKELINTIMERKAISEFRWTTTDEIVKKGGILHQLELNEYLKWFDKFEDKTKKKIVDGWGNPPGEEKDGVPPAMVYNGKILITGVKFGNVFVCVQPKRGCAGSRCDGQVCKILHDPDIPPPHQYLATYKYLENNVDVIIHVGTHGNLEFLPGKGVGLSNCCFPDISIGNIPHLYIYNSDNPAEGIIAKRRSYAILIDHMQSVLTSGGLYDELEELGRFLDEYEQVKNQNPARVHLLQHMIMNLVKKTNLDKEIKIENTHGHKDFDEIVRATHGALSRIRNTQIQDGMHIFGQLPEGEKRVDFINSILRYDKGDISLRRIFSSMMGMDLNSMLKNQGEVCPQHKKSYGEVLEELDISSKKFIKKILNNGENLEEFVYKILGIKINSKDLFNKLEIIKNRIIELNNRIDESKEIESLLDGFDAKFILPGPSGLITRGRDDVLPTGRNFYSLDPEKIPTKSAWEIGKKLTDAIIKKHKDEEGKIPENVAIYWMASDIMWTDGEGMAQIMYLLGTKPVWQNGKVKGIEIIPLSLLKRPRVDVTIRVSGITRDNFPNCIELVDEAIQKVASLNEPEDMNFVRKHTLEYQKSEERCQKSEEKLWREATYRIFASKPGTYGNGVNLAVYASAWKEEKDLSDIFIYWNGYAYGKEIQGVEAHKELTSNLKTVDITYNKVVSDEYDLFGCCCYFGTMGGMTASARHLSGKEVKTYYGDTRESENVEVRNMADEIRRVVRTKLLNPKWIEGMKKHGYKGAGDISKRIGRVYGWEATTQEVDDWIFDDVAKTFVLNEENRKFFEENNPWALEEIGRRLLEAYQRGLWKADKEVINELRKIYLEIESWMEEKMGDVVGDFQGGAVDIKTFNEVKSWSEKMKKIIR